MEKILLKIKRLILEGHYRFSDKADAEMEMSGLTNTDILEAIMNAHKIDKVMRSTSRGKTHRGEKVYVIRGLTYDNILIYTKGTIKKFEGQDILYFLISSKREGMV
ncbi:MAG: hypothetical protein AAB309_02420 [Deltaproteobacteria bacterium]